MWTTITIGWGIFVAWWVVVLRRESVRTLGLALGLLAAIVVVAAAATRVWTWHNIRLAKHGRRGNASLYIPMVWERDTLGRSLVMPPTDATRAASEVRVVVQGGAKSYLVVRAEEL